MYKNNGGNSFSIVWQSTINANTPSICFGDYNNDGWLDILEGNDWNYNRLYRNNGGNSFSIVWQSTINANTTSICFG
ncbi:MAG: VCBS repeat-containing protein, partial [Flavobacteriales bacterium]|nr:VCBS repeat-containing protein [Flavobacteriales bacterium]